ncbi:SLC13 family permease [Sphingomonas japonica]|uniref:Di/tricarboxylate transporter n=1 Tax=Sphingomonas japonica TaxID=511662 RepID=A0ABX0U1U5_9SPHN|nr:SLC13 family permease [Sphingomonas japonica]NIJ24530.1 di/tricarboxylate transporter [Sphingomonas japonica]
MSEAALSTIVLAITLILFVSEKVRHDLVALIALFACLVLGLVRPAQAFVGFADPAVLTVAAVLVVGRAVELSGVASTIARVAIPESAGFTVRLSLLLVVGALLSAFMNNIAALVITMPIATDIARKAKLPPAATLMPIAFATILGGMTTLIGTPANLILSSVREAELGEPFGFFTMSPVGMTVTAIGLVYLAVIGWRLLPMRGGNDREARPPWRIFELEVPSTDATLALAELLPRLRGASARLLAVFRSGFRVARDAGTQFQPGDRLLLVSRESQPVVAEKADLLTLHDDSFDRPGDVTARVAVAHGSPLVGHGHEEVRMRSDGSLRVVAVGPRAARERTPLSVMRIAPGDQLFIRGEHDAIADFVPRARLLEIDRLDLPVVAPSRAALTLAIFGIAITLIVTDIAPPAIAFLGAAVVLAATRLIPAEETYRSIDWSVIVLLGAMVPVGQSFDTSGAASIAALTISEWLTGLPLFVMLALLVTATMLLSIFLNNIATAIIMGPLAIEAATLLGISPDAALLAVLIGASSDFLTPIGHQNNLLVMGPGGYRFTDYARMGAVLVVLVVLSSAAVLSVSFA